MKKASVYLLIACYLFIPAGLLAEKTPETNNASRSDIQKIKAEGEHSKVMDIAFHLSDVSGPRLTVSPGFTRAANWAMTQLTSFGLKNVRVEPWGEFGKGWQQEKCYVAMTAPYYAPMIAIPKAWTGSTPGKSEIESEVVLIDATDSNSFMKKYAGKLEGKVVMLVVKDTLRPSFEGDARRYTAGELEALAKADPPGDGAGGQFRADANLMRRIAALREARKMAELINDANPALVLSYGRGSDGTLFVQQGGSPALGTKEVPATVALAADDYLRLQRLLLVGVPVKIAADVRTATFTDDTQGYNVIAEIPGTDPELKNEVVMCGAHLDSWQGSTGATDNAAGCAMMMEAVRMINAGGLKPRRTIRIVLWSGEEQGLLGSKAWIKDNVADPENMTLKPGHEKISAYYNLDNGSGRIRGIYCQGNLGVMPIFQEWLNDFNDSTAKTVTIRNTGGTDHTSFDAVGIPGFQFIQDELEYDTRTHHTNMDTYDHLVPEDMKQGATLAATFIFNTAQRDEKLPRKELPKPRSASSRF